MGTTTAGAGPVRLRRASTATTSGSTEPTANAPAIPAVTAGAAMVRCSSSTPIRARVPAPSPSLRRAAAQNVSWTSVKDPAARAWASAVEPGMAPGLRTRISR